MVQLSQLYVTNGKTIALTMWTFVSKVMSLLFNILCRFVIPLLDLIGIYFFFLRNLHTIPGKFSRDFIVNWYI